MKIISGAWIEGGKIPVKFTCDGAGISPALNFEDVPKEAKSLALIVEDPDAPNGTWTHWVVWNIDPRKTAIGEGETGFGVVGTNSGGRRGYYPACPPSGVHRYYFKLYALDTMLGIPDGSNKEEFLRVIDGHILTKAELMGRYSR